MRFSEEYCILVSFLRVLYFKVRKIQNVTILAILKLLLSQPTDDYETCVANSSVNRESDWLD